MASHVMQSCVADTLLPRGGKDCVSVTNWFKSRVTQLARLLQLMRFGLPATRGTAIWPKEAGIASAMSTFAWPFAASGGFGVPSPFTR